MHECTNAATFYCPPPPSGTPPPTSPVPTKPTPSSPEPGKPTPLPASICSPAPATSPIHKPTSVSSTPPPLPKRAETQIYTPPPPYQEQPPTNHAYKSGTRILSTDKIVPTRKRDMFPSDMDICQQALYLYPLPGSNLDATYEHAYCHNLILPTPAKKKPRTSPTSPTSDTPCPGNQSRSKLRCFWKRAVEKLSSQRLRNQTPKSTPRRSLPTHLVTVPPKTELLRHGAHGAHVATPPPKGIVKPPRTKAPVPTYPTIQQYPYAAGYKLKKSVSFSGLQLKNTRIKSTESAVKECPPMIQTYKVKDYIFTKL